MATATWNRITYSGLICLLVLAQCGCSGVRIFRGSDPTEQAKAKREEIREKLTSRDRPRVLAEIASPAMLTLSKLQNVGLVTQLDGTGGAVDPGSLRERMLDAMRRNDVPKPNAMLDHPATALVAVKAIVPPGARRGDVLDLIVTVPPVSHASDLSGGWLLETPLMEMRSLEGTIRESFEYMQAMGRIITEEQITGKDSEEAKTSGRILGGGRLEKSRSLGIVIDSAFADALTMAAVLPAINKRFTYFDGHQYKGVATPREDSYIEIEVPEKYRWDPYHYIHAVLHVGFNESPEERAARMEILAKQVLDPITVRRACWELEAIGEEATQVLAAALDSPDPEVRFYAAHSLAYLNDRRAIKPLKSLCRQEPAFRAMCLNGLLALDHYEATEALQELLHAADPEVRYGALIALRRDDAVPAEVEGETVDGVGTITEIPTTAPPLVAVSLTHTPEVIFFGGPPKLHIPAFCYVNKYILIAPSAGGQLRVSRFKPGEEDRIIQCAPNLRDALQAIAKVGGNYGDWVRFLREAYEAGYYVEPLALNPIPQAGRVYQRQESLNSSSLPENESLFSRQIVRPDTVESEVVPLPPVESEAEELSLPEAIDEDGSL